ncbi:uncharacterized protein LOC121504910 isoform X1 [Cheilinus undulatus]|uniref:uncharacterized protein LOC121504910 isoform X1 n=1 Tax=Cheilinus undulatus TaxID=241271 RepID=UPI001BD6C34F|nr:uncharacterized protein LOC121504910 isoform X1 [Cheilinus undulatus]
MPALNGALHLLCFCLWRMALTTGTKLMTVRQQGDFISADLGANVTFKCFYEGKASAAFFWYKQTIGQIPRLVSTFYKYDIKGDFSEEFKDNPRFTLESGNGNNHLTISNVIPSDSATYYCVSSYAYNFDFADGTTLSVKGGISESGWTIQALVHQSAAETSSAALSCTVHTGTCDGEHSVYWFRNSEEAHPGLIYTHGGRNDQCERNPNTETNTCVFNLPLDLLNLSHAGTYYCAVATCGHILFGNGTIVDSAEKKNPPESLVFFLSGALAFTSILLVALIILVCTMNKRSCFSTESQRGSASTTAAAEGYEEADSLHYAAVRTQRTNRPRAQRENTTTECVYSSVRQ